MSHQRNVMSHSAPAPPRVRAAIIEILFDNCHSVKEIQSCAVIRCPDIPQPFKLHLSKEERLAFDKAHMAKRGSPTNLSAGEWRSVESDTNYIFSWIRVVFLRKFAPSAVGIRRAKPTISQPKQLPMRAVIKVEDSALIIGKSIL